MKANKTPIEDLRKVALKHYQDMSNYCCDYSSFVVEAIKAYNPELASQSEPNTVTEEEIDQAADEWFESTNTLSDILPRKVFKVGAKWALQQTQAVGVSEDEIDLLVKFFGEARIVDDPDLEKLDKLDALFKNVYSKNRIKLDFGRAASLARKAVILELLNQKK